MDKNKEETVDITLFNQKSFYFLKMKTFFLKDFSSFLFFNFQVRTAMP